MLRHGLALSLLLALCSFPATGEARASGDDSVLPGQADYNLAIRSLKRRKFKRAIAAFERALPHYNSSSDIFYNLVTACDGAKNYRKTVLYGAGFNYLEPTSEDGPSVNEKVKKAQDQLRKLNAKISKVSFDIKPLGAEVSVNHVPVGLSGRGSTFLYAGSYTVRSNYYDHHPTLRSILVKEGEPLVVKATMERIITHGTLVIKSTPAKGVTVYVDKKKVGVTPLKPLTLRSGEHYVRFEKKGWDRWHRYVTIDNDRKLEVEATLERTPTGKSPYRAE